MKSKKAMSMGMVCLLTVLLLAGSIALVLYFMFNAYKVQEGFGGTQRAMIDSYAEAEMGRTYLKHATEAAVYQTLFELGEGGGYISKACAEGDEDCFEEKTPCLATTDGYSIWSGSGCPVAKEKLIEMFNSSFIYKFENYLTKYIIGWDLESGDLINLYDSVELDPALSLEGEIKIIGYPRIIEITQEQYDEEGNPIDGETKSVDSMLMINDEMYGFLYGVIPYFEVQVPFDLGIYSEVYSSAQEAASRVKQCGGDQNCANSVAEEFKGKNGFTWTIKTDTSGGKNTLRFDLEYDSLKTLGVNAGDIAVYGGIPIKFAMEV